MSRDGDSAMDVFTFREKGDRLAQFDALARAVDSDRSTELRKAMRAHERKLRRKAEAKGVRRAA